MLTWNDTCIIFESCSRCLRFTRGKIKRGNPEALHLRNVDVNLVESPESLIVPELSCFWTALFTVQSLAGNWEPFWYEVISCAKEFDLCISI